MPRIQKFAGVATLRTRFGPFEATGVIDEWTKLEITVPTEGVIHRVRAICSDNSNQVEFMVAEKDPDIEGVDGLHMILLYGPTDAKIDSEEYCYYLVAPDDDLTDGEGADKRFHGSLFIGVKTNNSTPSTVSISFDVEIAV